MSSYRLMTYLSDRGPRAGFAVEEKVYDLAEAAGKERYNNILAVLQD